ncbi:MAG TPA: DUF600 family protein [Epsilonproteobacteria bacterium]|nr:DUF600 family protein [Campylobacterota bacterium]
MMFKNIDDILKDITDSLTNSVKDEWIEINFDAKVTDGSVGYSGKYLTIDGNYKQIDFWDNDYNLPKYFKNLYKTMTKESDKHKWNRAKVTLTNDGKLNIKFDWDQELADELEALSKEYDPRWDDSLTQAEKDKKYKEMVESVEVPDLSKV